jgi:hypothetical protein
MCVHVRDEVKQKFCAVEKNDRTESENHEPEITQQDVEMAEQSENDVVPSTVHGLFSK